MNHCRCDAGFSGNPYTGCHSSKPQPDKEGRHPPPAPVVTCDTLKCAPNAICSLATGRPECVCTRGFEGDPYRQCTDVDECLIPNVCVRNAKCINIRGSYDCRCAHGFAGNPFKECHPTTQPALNINRTEVNLCSTVQCGPNAVCHLGQCLCAQGFKGDDPYDVIHGCSAISTCRFTTDCGYNEICASLHNSIEKFCVDPCSKASCGPNSFCVTDNHNMNCICNQGFSGNPNDHNVGCTAEVSCASSKDCPAGTVCQINIDGQRTCLDPCQIMSCPEGEQCAINAAGRPTCACLEGYAKNKFTGLCKPSTGPGRCQRDSDCGSPGLICREQLLGFKECIDICSTVSCPVGAECVEGRGGQCQCKEGYVGNPESFQGCTPARTDQCSSNADCPENEACHQSQGKKSCRPACQLLACGPGAVCVTRNHIGKCICPEGLYKGDPFKTGCQKVNCLENEDCPTDQYCDRLSYTCMTACPDDICGTNAICLAENHHHTCKCPPKFIPSPTPDVSCKPQEKGQICPAGQCQTTCATKDQCLPGQTCRSGLCIEGCSANEECPGKLVCINNRCQDACNVACGPNSICKKHSKGDLCQCPGGFAGVPTAIQGCVRIPEFCAAGSVCSAEGHICHDNYCLPQCKSHGECARGEQCSNGLCKKLCHSDKNCLRGEICVDKFCEAGCRGEVDCKAGQFCGEDGRCACKAGYIRTPHGCQDINECETDICGPAMTCKNTPVRGRRMSKLCIMGFENLKIECCNFPDTAH